MNGTLFIDIETIPAIHLDEDQRREMAQAGVPKNYKKPESVDKWLDEHGDEAFAKTSLDSMAGHIIAVGLAFDRHPVHVVCMENEEHLMAEVQALIVPTATKDTIWVGHYLKMFDLPYLRHRAFALGLEDLARMIPSDKWGRNCRDTMEIWGGTNYRGFYKLDAIRAYLGMPDASSGLDGSLVYETYLAGELERIAEYCKSDVELVRDVYRRIS